MLGRENVLGRGSGEWVQRPRDGSVPAGRGGQEAGVAAAGELDESDRLAGFSEGFRFTLGEAKGTRFAFHYNAKTCGNADKRVTPGRESSRHM